MAFKTITIKEEVFDLLTNLKQDNESFSDLLRRLAEKHAGLAILEKLQGSFDLGDTESLIEDIYARRENWRS